MSGPDLIDERFNDLVNELRSTEVTASPDLRERVRGIAARKQQPRAGTRFGRRRRALVLVPVAAALAAAVGFGAFSSGSSPRQTVLGLPQALSPAIPAGAPRAKPNTANGSVFQSGTSTASGGFHVISPVAPSGSRAQIYAVDLELRVSDLSSTTKQAIQLTRGWGGYLVSVDSGSGTTSGSAYLVLRVPIVKVQTAVAKLTALGTIVTDHVSIQDVQGQLNKRYSQMQGLRVKIANLRAKLTETTLTPSQRAFFQAALTQRMAQLGNLQQQQVAEKTRVSFATLSLALETKKAAAVVPSRPGRIGQALHNIGRVLVTEAEVLIYVLLIGGPFPLVAALLWASRRSFRRRSEEQLLAR